MAFEVLCNKVVNNTKSNIIFKFVLLFETAETIQILFYLHLRRNYQMSHFQGSYGKDNDCDALYSVCYACKAIFSKVG
jgi:hypothetical protein